MLTNNLKIQFYKFLQLNSITFISKLLVNIRKEILI